MQQNYIATIEQLFLSLKDSGMFLSSSDVHLISQWQARGIPVDTLCRAIEKSFAEQKKQSRNSFQQKVSLSSLEKLIETKIDRA